MSLEIKKARVRCSIAKSVPMGESSRVDELISSHVGQDAPLADVGPCDQDFIQVFYLHERAVLNEFVPDECFSLFYRSKPEPDSP